jgi:hypothetical protein
MVLRLCRLFLFLSAVSFPGQAAPDGRSGSGFRRRSGSSFRRRSGSSFRRRSGSSFRRRSGSSFKLSPHALAACFLISDRMRELRARLCLSCFLFVFGSVDFFLVPLPWFVLVLRLLLVFCFAVVQLVSDERAFCISRAWRSFGRHLYIRRLCT